MKQQRLEESRQSVCDGEVCNNRFGRKQNLSLYEDKHEEENLHQVLEQITQWLGCEYNQEGPGNS